MVLTVLLALVFYLHRVPNAADSDYDPNLVEDVRVTNNRRIPADTIKYQLQTKAGDRFEYATSSMAMSKGSMPWISSTTSGSNDEEGKIGKIIIFWVKEKKTIRSVKYEGLKSITNSEIIDKVEGKKCVHRPGIDLRSQQDQKGGNDHQDDACRERASGCHGSTATTEDVPPNSVALTFKVDEGPKVRIEKITIQGNKVFSARRSQEAR